MYKPRQKVRPVEIVGDVGYVTLSTGVKAVVDAEDVPAIQSWNWTTKVGPRTMYAARLGQKDADGLRRPVLMHRQLTNCPPGLVVDHIDGDGLNNRRSNLRVCTTAENQRNRHCHRDPLSETEYPVGHTGFRNVLKGRRGGYLVRVKINGKAMDLAYGPDPSDLFEIREWYLPLYLGRRTIDEATAIAEALSHPRLSAEAALTLFRKMFGRQAVDLTAC